MTSILERPSAPIEHRVPWTRSRAEAGTRDLPVTFPTILRVAERLCAPLAVSGVYVGLACAASPDGVVSDRDVPLLVRDAGFSGPQASAVWRRRVDALQSAGFVGRPHAGSADALLLHEPHRVIFALKRDGVAALDLRAVEDLYANAVVHGVHEALSAWDQVFSG